MNALVVLSVLSSCCVTFVYLTGGIGLVLTSVYYGTGDGDLFIAGMFYWCLAAIASFFTLYYLVPPLVYLWFYQPDEIEEI